MKILHLKKEVRKEKKIYAWKKVREDAHRTIVVVVPVWMA
jgi:hypothetical protein